MKIKNLSIINHIEFHDNTKDVQFIKLSLEDIGKINYDSIELYVNNVKETNAISYPFFYTNHNNVNKMYPTSVFSIYLKLIIDKYLNKYYFKFFKNLDLNISKLECTDVEYNVYNKDIIFVIKICVNNYVDFFKLFIYNFENELIKNKNGLKKYLNTNFYQIENYSFNEKNRIHAFCVENIKNFIFYKFSQNEKFKLTLQNENFKDFLYEELEKYNILKIDNLFSTISPYLHDIEKYKNTINYYDCVKENTIKSNILSKDYLNYHLLGSL